MKELLIIFSFSLFFTLISDAQNKYLVPVNHKGLWGFVNLDNELIVDPVYDDAGLMMNGYAIVEKQGKFGFVDVNGEVLGRVKYDTVRNFYDREYAWVWTKGNWKAINRQGRLHNKEIPIYGGCGNGMPVYINPTNYYVQGDSCISLLLNKPIPSNTNSLVKFQKEATTCTYGNVRLLGERSLIVDSAGRSGVWWPGGDYYEVDIDWVFEDVVIDEGVNQANKLHKFKKDKLWGFIDAKGRIRIAAKYLSVQFYPKYSLGFGGIIPMTKVEYETNKFGYIDKKGNEYFWKEEWNSD